MHCTPIATSAMPCGPSCAPSSARRPCSSCCCSPASTARCPISPMRCGYRSSHTRRSFRPDVVSDPPGLTPRLLRQRLRRLGRTPDLLQARGAAAGSLVVLIAVRILLVVVLVVVLRDPERAGRED